MYLCLENHIEELGGLQSYGAAKSWTLYRAEHRSTAGPWVGSPVLSGRFSFVICFILSNVCVSIPVSQCIPPLPRPCGVHRFVLTLCLSNKIYIIFLDSMYALIYNIGEHSYYLMVLEVMWSLFQGPAGRYSFQRLQRNLVPCLFYLKPPGLWLVAPSSSLTASRVSPSVADSRLVAFSSVFCQILLCPLS